jgi:hypothetical protein
MSQEKEKGSPEERRIERDRIKEEKKKTKEDVIVEELFPDSNIIMLESGEELEIKPLSWGKEIKVLKLVSGFFGDSEILSAVTAISKIKDNDEDSAESLGILSNILLPAINEAPDAITEIVAIITDETKEFVEESLTSEDVMKVFVPFLKKLFTKYTKMFNLGQK